MTKRMKITLIVLSLLCIESALIDHIMDMQEKEEAQSQRWNTALIREIDALANNH